MLKAGSAEKKALAALAAALLVIQAVLSAGCAKLPPEQVRIGAIYPLTGSLATIGSDIKNGLQLVAEVVNNEYDLDLPLARSRGISSLGGAEIALIFGDSQGSPAAGKAEAERLIVQEKVAALVGCYQSAVTAEASQVAESKGIPFLTAVSTAPGLTQREFKWFFRTTPNDEIFVRNFYEFLQDVEEKKGTRVRRLGVVHENSVWGTEFSKYLEQYAKRYGCEVVANISYSSDTTDVTGEVAKLKAARPDVVFQASYTGDSILFMQAYRKAGFNPQGILSTAGGFLAPEFLRVLGKDANHVLTRGLWSPDLAATRPAADAINKLFRERYGTDMNDTSARAFTGLLVLADAINRAGSTRPEAVHKALLETDMPAGQLIMPWEGVRFDQKTHENTLGKGIMLQVIDGRYRVVWPKGLAAADLVWPMPEMEKQPASIAMVMDTGGPEDDFNKRSLLGGQRAQSELGIKLDYAYARAISEVEGLLRQYAESGKYGLIISIGGTQADAMVKVAADFPQQKFAIVDAAITDPPNIASILFRDSESSFLAGALAAIVSRTGKIGFIGGMDIPVIQAFLRGYQDGAGYANCKSEVLVSFAGSWADPETGKSLALAQYDSGADVIFAAAGFTGSGVIQAARERGLYAIGVDVDQRHLAPDNVLVSAVKMLDMAVFDLIRDTIEGGFNPGVRSLGLKENGVGLSLDNALPVVNIETKETLDRMRDGILSGEIRAGG